MLPLILLLQDVDVAAAYAEYREKTKTVVSCQAPRDSDEITVCARRESYRYQLPLVSTAPQSDANTQANIVASEEARGFTPCGEGAFTVRCGSVGVGVTTAIGPNGGGEMRRAPPP